MKAYVIEKFGGPEVFKSKTIPTPKIKAGHILVRTYASSVNPVDCKIRSGIHSAISPDFPAILHGDFAGVVVEVGSGVTRFKEGDKVYGCAGGFKGSGGALGEYMLVDAQLIAHKPKSLSMIQSAALPLVAITAWEALINRAKLQVNQTVLIHGATGGVGHIAIQLAKWKGAIVYATASSSEKLVQAKHFGAQGIDYKKVAVQEYVNKYTKGKGFDVVFDTVGGENLEKSYEACKINGVVSAISTRTTCDLTLLHKKGLTMHVIFMPIPLLYDIGRQMHGAILTEFSELIDNGEIKPLIDKRFYFSEISAAHKYFESGKSMGKVVLEQDFF